MMCRKKTCFHTQKNKYENIFGNTIFLMETETTDGSHVPEEENFTKYGPTISKIPGVMLSTNKRFLFDSSRYLQNIFFFFNQCLFLISTSDQVL